MSAQGTLFDAAPLLARDEVEDYASGLDHLDDWAFLYTATEAGNSTGVRFMASREDAMKWCSSPLSAGQLHGVRWAYYWTSIRNFLVHRAGWIPEHGGQPSMELKLDTSADSGAWDERVASTGCQMIRIAEIPARLAPAVKVTLA